MTTDTARHHSSESWIVLYSTGLGIHCWYASAHVILLSPDSAKPELQALPSSMKYKTDDQRCYAVSVTELHAVSIGVTLPNSTNKLFAS